MLPVLLVSLAVALCWANETTFFVPNVIATFQDTPRPFEIHVDPGFIEDTRQRVRLARAPHPVGSIDEGPSLENFTTIRDFWVNDYDWNATQTEINEKLQQFTTVVHTTPQNSSAESWDVPLHFVHHRSPRADAIPLLFIHGWPGSFLEVSKIIDQLTHPPNASVPAFHVVAPSLPGFGFSPAPQRVGFGPVEAAQAFDALMLKLQYPKYVIQGGDFGGVILRYQTSLYPDHVVSALSNFWIVQPGDEDLRQLAQGQSSDDEIAYIHLIETYNNAGSGYRILQQTEPLTIAYATTDSPLGNALWNYALMKRSTDPGALQWSASEIITWSMMYYIQGPYAGMRMYKEVVTDGALIGLDFGNPPPVTRPVAISQFPYDIGYRLPLHWAQRGGNVVQRTLHQQGGHFAAYEVPALLLNDIWAWFGDKAKSKTDIFVDSSN